MISLFWLTCSAAGWISRSIVEADLTSFTAVRHKLPRASSAKKLQPCVSGISSTLDLKHGVLGWHWTYNCTQIAGASF